MYMMMMTIVRVNPKPPIYLSSIPHFPHAPDQREGRKYRRQMGTDE